jgi:cytochrome c553
VNHVLWAARSGSGDYPVGSAAIKVTYDAAGAKKGHYIDTRLQSTSGSDGWFFYVLGGPSGYGAESQVSFCADCHDNAGARDYVRRVPVL